jgi:hypothetical protein
MQGIILLLVALGALGAFSAGIVLLFLYFRAGRGNGGGDEPVVYGNLVQCPRCGYMNPLDSAACLNCRSALPRPQTYQPAPPTTSYAPDYSAYRPPSPPLPPAPSVPPARPTPPPQRYAAESAAPVPQRTVPVVSSATAPASSTPDAIFAPPAPAAAPGAMPRAWLEGTGGAMMGHTAALEKADTLIGRSTSCDVQVYDPKVSRRHIMIRFANGAFFLQDQQSSRGTSINGERVMAQRLQNGDRIELGDTSLIFHTD